MQILFSAALYKQFHEEPHFNSYFLMKILTALTCICTPLWAWADLS
jgi:hypothetical protein